jgi:DNA polymerase-3 subunit beta
MRIFVSSAKLLKNLQVLSGVINTSNTMPILDNFLFDFEGNLLKVTASDLETTMKVNIEIESQEKGLACVPARLLIDILKTLPEQPLVLEFLENNVLKIKTDSGIYEIAYVSGLEFPKVIEMEETSRTIIPSKVLSTAISKTIFATGTDDLRPQFTGVYFQLTTTGLIFAATDAHKLVKYSRKDIQATEEASFVMPKKALNVLKGILQTLEVDVVTEYNQSNAKYVFDQFELICRLIDAKYPNYEAVIPKENPNKLTIDRNLLATSVNRVSILSSKETHQMRLGFKGNELTISAEDKETSKNGNEVLTCSYTGNDFAIGFNSKLLLEMLKNTTAEQVTLEMSEPNRAGILMPLDGQEEGEELLMLVMPVMLK